MNLSTIEYIFEYEKVAKNISEGKRISRVFAEQVEVSSVLSYTRYNVLLGRRASLTRETPGLGKNRYRSWFLRDIFVSKEYFTTQKSKNIINFLAIHKLFSGSPFHRDKVYSTQTELNDCLRYDYCENQMRYRWKQLRLWIVTQKIPSERRKLFS